MPRNPFPLLAFAALVLPALCAAAPADPPALSTPDLAALRASAAEATTSVTLRWTEQLDGAQRLVSAPVKLRRIEVYAPQAKVFVADAQGLHEVPRDSRAHFISVGNALEKLALSIGSDDADVSGTLIASHGVFELRAEVADGSAALRALRAPTAKAGAMEHACEPAPKIPEFAVIADAIDAAQVPALPAAAIRQATVAVDTDNELLSLKFSNNTANATAYVASLFAALNVIYEDDAAQNGLQLRLVQGSVVLRPSTTADPYPSTSGTSIQTQLTEFGEYWRLNQSAVSRAFAMMLSGKLSSGASGGFSGIAWVLTSGTYCQQTGFVFGTPSQTAGHYSVNRVNSLPGSGASADVTFVGHELGHNLGANHTHCTNRTTGADSSTNTIDRCYNQEPGCYSGATACPTAQESPVAPTGSIMSYCHLIGCGIAGEFHPTHQTQLDARLDSQPTTCIGPLTGNQAPTINAPTSFNGSEDQTLTLNGLSFADADAGSGNLTATFAVPSGTLTALASSGVTIGGNATSRTLGGTLAALNGLLAAGNLRYVPTAETSGTVNLAITINDNGNSGGGAQGANRSVPINIAAVNDAPSLSAPASIGQTEDQSGPIAGISFADVDAGAASVVATFSVPAGTLSASGTGLVSVGGTALARTLSGNLGNLNSYIASGNLMYLGAGNANGSVTLTVTINDQGNSGGPAQQAQDTIALQIAAANDAPTVNGPGALSVMAGQSIGLGGISYADADGSGINVTASYAAASGTFSASSGGGVSVTGSGTGNLTLTGTLSAINSRIAGTPVQYNASAALPGLVPVTLSVNDQGNVGGGALTGSAILTVTVMAADVLFMDGME